MRLLQMPDAMGWSRTLLGPIERELVRSIRASTAASDELLRLEGTTLRVIVLGTPLRVDVVVEDATVRVEPAQTGSCAATITGPPWSLLRLAGAQTAAGARSSLATLSGDLELIERWSKLLRLARPSLEQRLADWIGDVPAHELSKAGMRLGAWGRRAFGASRMNLAEYLQEESRQLPAALEAEALFEDIERLRDDVERAGRRLDLLAARKR
jgi:ubiquinone biosynthesis protein UbiJ